jgi:ketosteroid isomerase-like protein
VIKERSSAVVVDREAIKTEIQAMEDAFAESYNNKNTDSIKYYSEDAVSFQMVKCLEGKKRFMNP